MSESGERRFRTIKSLVIDHVHRKMGRVDYHELTREVRVQFPHSKWKRTHWAWYKSEILRGRFRAMFTEAELAALAESSGRSRTVAPPPPAAPQEGGTRGPAPREPEVKRLGDPILNHVRLMLDLAAGDDEAKRFKLNRWVFSRLLQDEIRVKRPIKRKLWDAGTRSCQACGQPFKALKGVELHRKDESQGYSLANCELLCRECHQELGQ